MTSEKPQRKISPLVTKYITDHPELVGLYSSPELSHIIKSLEAALLNEGIFLKISEVEETKRLLQKFEFQKLYKR